MLDIEEDVYDFIFYKLRREKVVTEEEKLKPDFHLIIQNY